MSKTNDNSKQETFFAIVSCEIDVWDALERSFQQEGLPISVGRFIPLHRLASGPLRLGELTVCTHAKESAMSRMVERMIQDGLIEKKRDDHDGRAIHLLITDEGKRVEKRARAVFERCLEGIFDGLSEDDLGSLRMTFSRIQATCERMSS